MPTLVQRLADSQDAAVRDRAMETLRDYLRDELEELAMRKLWRAIFFAMWLSDLAPVQRELASRVASLIHAFSEPEAACRWLDAFCATFRGEWERLDKYRVDKYYFLARLVLREAINFADWAKVKVHAVTATLEAGLLTRLPNGPRLHACDVILDEAKAVLADKPCEDHQPIAALLAPFLELLRQHDATIFARALDRVVVGLREAVDLPGHAKLLEWIQPKVYAIAADPATPDRHRPALYATLKTLVARTNLPLDVPDRPPPATDGLTSARKRRIAKSASGGAMAHKRRKLALLRRFQGKKRAKSF